MSSLLGMEEALAQLLLLALLASGSSGISRPENSCGMSTATGATDGTGTGGSTATAADDTATGSMLDVNGDCGTGTTNIACAPIPESETIRTLTQADASGRRWMKVDAGGC